MVRQLILLMVIPVNGILRDVKGYINAINNGKEFFESEELDTKTRFNEYIMTSLRTMWGIDLEYVEKMFEKEGYDYVVNLAGKVQELWYDETGKKFPDSYKPGKNDIRQYNF